MPTAARFDYDPVLLEEVELYADLVIAASASAGPLPAGQLDEILGLPHAA